MKSSPASKLRALAGHVLSLQLLVAAGCVAIPQNAESIATAPVFRDPLAIRGAAKQSERARVVRVTDQALRSLDAWLLSYLHRERIAAWNTWARDHVRDGDIVFLQSTSNWVWGVIELSQVTQDVTASPFTHVAVAAIEHGDVVLYDIDMPGPGRTPFGVMMANSKTAAVAIKRLHPEFQPFVPKAIEYCRRVYASQLAFDDQLNLDNDKLYCSELVEVAFRASGLELSRPIRWDALPGLDKHPIAVRTIAWANGTNPQEFVIVPGNDRFGIWGSPGLELVLPLTNAKNPPASRGSREPQTPQGEL